jgi:hypothetical protein
LASYASLRAGQLVFGAVASLALAAVLSPGAAMAAALGLGVAAAGRLVAQPAQVGWRRTLLEIGVPAWIGWAGLGGAASVPAALAVEMGFLGDLRAWAAVNWAFPLALASFAVVHHGATAALRKQDLRGRHRELIVGYVGAVAVLALAGHGLVAAAVALLFVLQWPFQASFRHGRVRWHLELAQLPTMAAMVLAFVAIAH